MKTFKYTKCSYPYIGQILHRNRYPEGLFSTLTSAVNSISGIGNLTTINYYYVWDKKGKSFWEEIEDRI